MPFLLFLLAVIGVTMYVSTFEERQRFLRFVAATPARCLPLLRHFHAAHGSFDEALRARTPWLIAMPAVLAASLGAFAARLFGEGAVSDPATMIRWGANFGPLTAHGEWWRLVTATFLSDGVVAMLAGLIAVAQIGPILERQLGHFTFGAVFVAAGVFGGLMDLSAYSGSVTTSGTAAVLGLYGLLSASIVRGALRRSELSVPLTTIARVVPVAGMFLIAAVGMGPLDLADKAGLFTGFVSGLVVSRDLRTRKPTAQRLAIVTSATVAIAAAAYVPLRGFTDIRPELTFLIALEEKTASAYEAAVRRFRLGRETPRAMADLIERSILPELEAADARIGALPRVPAAHRPAIATAHDYLRLRNESWRLRVEALGKSDMRLLRKADATEHASLAVLEQLKSAAHALRGA
jgi:membrane associated rhomboid family serine protease